MNGARRRAGSSRRPSGALVAGVLLIGLLGACTDDPAEQGGDGGAGEATGDAPGGRSGDDRAPGDAGGGDGEAGGGSGTDDGDDLDGTRGPVGPTDPPNEPAPRAEEFLEDHGDEVQQATVILRAEELAAGHRPPTFDTSVATGSLEVFEAGEGHPAVLEAVYDGSGVNGYSRVQLEVEWDSGDEVSYGLAVYLPEGFLDAQQGAIDLIRWDNWPLEEDTTDHGGVALNSDGRLRLITERHDVVEYTEILGSVDMPEGRWVTIEVWQRLSEHDGEAYNELWVDGELVGTSTDANLYNPPITRIRAGLVSMDEGTQIEPLVVYFDEVAIGPT